MGTRSVSNAHRMQPGMFDKFDWEKDENGQWVCTTDDIRNQTILIGPQYAANGDPITIKTTYSKLNREYDGPTPGKDTIWHLSFSREIWLRGDPPLSFVNEIRARANATLYTAEQLTLDELLDERAREFQHEAHRRTDLIRFGKFHEPRLFRSNESEPYRQLFPIPSNQINLNPKLVQNPGY